MTPSTLTGHRTTGYVLEMTNYSRSLVSPDDQHAIRMWAREREVRVNLGKSRYGWICRVYPPEFGSPPLSESSGALDPITAYLRAVKGL